MPQEREKDLLRFSTAGSVDDGKSTLIGRLLYDTQSVYEDQVRSIEGKGTTAPGQIDFALLTDGLRAEREQGITIDVAYRYFSTPKRKFIIADTPGHEQYTRNMATGASTADAAIVLIDASKGVLIQSRRHAYIASLLRVRHVIVAVNKMDLIGYDEAAFRAIERTSARCSIRSRRIPARRSKRSLFPSARWPATTSCIERVVERHAVVHGPSLLELLESLPSSQRRARSLSAFPCSACFAPITPFADLPARSLRELLRRAIKSPCFPRAEAPRLRASSPSMESLPRPCAVVGHAGAGSRTRHQPRRSDRLRACKGHGLQAP